MLNYPIVKNHPDLARVVDLILNEAGLDRADQGGNLTFTGLDPIRRTHLKVGAISAAVIAANSIATSILWRERTGEGQDIHVDLRKSYVTQSPWQANLAQYTTMNGTSQMTGGNIGQLGALLLPTRDNRWVILTSLYAANTERVCKLLNCGILPEQLEKATRQWDAASLETAAQDAGVPLAVCRTSDEYKATEQYKYNVATPLIHIEKIGESPAEPLPSGERPLSGLRVLGMTHVVAGPTVLRQLAAQGADCLNLNSAHWVELPAIYWQCYAGIRQAFKDVRNDANISDIYALARQTDVFVQNLRPHMAARRGFSAQTLAEHRPGIICVDIGLNASKGPWADWIGYDFIAGGLTGLFCDIGSADQPRLPNDVNVVCDFMTGYLAAIGVQAALLRRAREGGSYRVSVNLAQTIMLEQAIGLIDTDTLMKLDTLGDDHKPLPPHLQMGQTAFGEFTRMGSQVDMSKTPEYWADPIINPIGSSRAEWLR
ncbi:CoA transferase [Phyllobacterium sp. OV277]|uniref:CoA transferase n=1 Tax=Phyllobacterium sp. OV277 TaxID=1882772 RepID=UPI00088EBF76|nr:CoA transferase [Phyllobacterium sp. OV277]SDP39533.1 CoA-transferase family III [Phyllobacterium sp. OV277]